MIDRALALSTDLYELAMAAAYFDNGLSEERAVFELFVRNLPRNRSFLISAGLEQALEYLVSLRFTGEEIDYVRSHPSFNKVNPSFFDYLAEVRFTGDVWAMREGTVAFEMEPLLRVTAPIIEAQIVETYLLATINFQTMIASKAARVVAAAQGRSVVEFGTRRAHGSEAGLFAARAAYIGGCSGTSNVEAGHLFGIPTFGTLAHSFVMSFDNEDDAFQAFLRVFPETATVLVDTYDTIRAVKRLSRLGVPEIAAVRLDSGDLRALSIETRDILDRAGMRSTKIFASGDLNEHKISKLIEGGARIDAFGVGTELATSYDSPAIPAVYKLVALERGDQCLMRIKLSKDKKTYPGPKQVWRKADSSRVMAGDLVALANEPPPGERQPGTTWQPLLVSAIERGKLSAEFAELAQNQDEPIRGRRRRRLDALERARTHASGCLQKLPGPLRLLEPSPPYPVSFSLELTTCRQQLEESIIDELKKA
jgi:nicotinate phosphoribosyltransferase